MRSSEFSLRSRLSSTRSSSSIAWPDSSALLTHSPIDFALMPSSIARSAIDRLLCLTRFTASDLNSSENRLLVFRFAIVNSSKKKTSFLS